MLQVATIEELPLTRLNLKILTFFAILKSHNWRRYALITPYVLLTVGDILDIYYNDEPIDAVMRKVYMTMLFLNAIIRAIYVCLRRFDYEDFLEYLRQLYNELQLSKNPKVQELLDEAAKVGTQFTKMNLAAGSFAYLGFIAFPLFTAERDWPVGIFIPFVEKFATPWYQLVYIGQVLVSPWGLFMFIPFSSFVVCFTLFAIAMCKVLQLKLQNFENISSKVIRAELVWCIGFQLKLIRVIEGINELNSYMFLIEYILCGVMLCGMLFVLVIVKTFAEIPIVIIFIFLVLTQSFALYYYSTELYAETLAIAIAAYDTNWYGFDVKSQKMMKLFILRAQKPCGILIGKVYPMNMVTFLSLIKVAYSFFALLKQTYA